MAGAYTEERARLKWQGRPIYWSRHLQDARATAKSPVDDSKDYRYRRCLSG
ncbi:MAG: hypothetical protein JJE34_00175 [Alphaproteobacteria bacterium]|nr:hypothetical protein [Alphaproteobacteria bacterium]